MPQADTIPAVIPAETSTIAPALATVSGWGGGRAATVRVLRPDGVDQAREAVQVCRSSPPNGRSSPGAIARGMGRSYGDAAQLSGGFVLDTRRMRDFELDAEHRTVTAQAGATIGELLHALVPAGWMVPVVPGTQHVTVGGAIASDIHGKNHGTAGTFGSYVKELGLLTAAGEVLELEPGSEILAATIGGMGLTGVILWARIALRPVTSPLLSVDVDRAPCLDDALALLSSPGGPHRVAWLDLLGRHPGRGVVTRAEHIDGAGQAARRDGATVRARATVPERWPAGLLRGSTARAFNELWYRRSPRRARGRIEPIGSHMFPLDALDAWPRLYGPRGLQQYQLVVPPGGDNALYAVIERLRRARVPCYLAVLKDFGPANDAPLSFPIEGWTLALDLPSSVPGLDAVLTQLDELVAESSGRVYLTKDARLQPAAVTAMYPRLDEWRAAREKVDPDFIWRSDLALRTGLIPRGAR